MRKCKPDESRSPGKGICRLVNELEHIYFSHVAPMAFGVMVSAGRHHHGSLLWLIGVDASTV
jgi:hypothetical protein